jgi:hypothetical protein
MMKYLKFSILFLLILAAVACGKKIHISDVTMSGDKTYYHSQAYTGTVWTDDEQSGKFVTDKGMLTSLTFYHRNNQKAIEMTIDPQTKTPTSKMWDDKGKEISIMQFQQQYMDILVKMAMTQKQIAK